MYHDLQAYFDDFLAIFTQICRAEESIRQTTLGRDRGMGRFDF